MLTLTTGSKGRMRIDHIIDAHRAHTANRCKPGLFVFVDLDTYERAKVEEGGILAMPLLMDYRKRVTMEG